MPLQPGNFFFTPDGWQPCANPAIAVTIQSLAPTGSKGSAFVETTFLEVQANTFAFSTQ